MRIYHEKDRESLQMVVCNCCGRQIPAENGILKESVLAVDRNFGYFSHRDGVKHSFDLCDVCYDRYISTFQIPVEETEIIELM